MRLSVDTQSRSSCILLLPLFLPTTSPHTSTPPHTGQGEYVAVEKVEAVLRDCPLVAQAMVHAEPGGRQLMALMVPRFEALLSWADEHRQVVLCKGISKWWPALRPYYAGERGTGNWCIMYV